MNVKELIEKMQVKKYSRRYRGNISIESMVNYNGMSLAKKRFLKEVDFNKEQLKHLLQNAYMITGILEIEYSVILNSEAMRVFGRPWNPSDYRISAIGCSEFSEEAKNILRNNRHQLNSYNALIALLEYVKRYG